jgi:ABC-type sugar transport system permease subunit/ABC-type glycerol-3-phosphate transport system substrate-binding protein
MAMRMPRLRIVALFLGLGWAALAPAQRHEVIVWGIGYGPESKGLETLVREFERRNPDLKVRMLSMGAGRMNPQKLMTSIVGNVSPDAVHQDRFSVADWASRGAFRPLDDLIERDRGKDPLTPVREQYYPSAWEEGSYGGKIYAIPTSGDNRALYYNRKIFREKADALRRAGLDPDRPPRTWSELLAYGRALTEHNKDGTLKVAGFMPNYGNSWLYMYAFQNNASFLSEDGRTCTMNTPETLEALRFIVEGYDQIGGYEKAKAFETGFLANENDPFILGKVAMKIDGDWILANISRYGPNLDFATAPPPVPDDRFHKRGRFAEEKETFVSWMGGFSWAIPRGARNVEAAWRWIKFATSTEGRLIENKAQRAWTMSRGRDYIPRQSGSMHANEGLFRELKPRDAKFAAALRQHMDLMPVSRIRPPTFVGQLLWDEHVRAMEMACYKKVPPEVALTNAETTVQRNLNEFFRSDEFPVIDTRGPVAAAWLGGGILAVALLIGYRRQRLGRLARHEARWAYLFVSPWAIGFLIFIAGPMLASLLFSFTQYDVLNEMRWVGARNYVQMVSDDSTTVVRAWSNVLYLAGIGVPLSIMTGLAVALLLNTAVRGMRFYRTLFYMPAIVPTVAASVLWIWILASDPNKGLINAFWTNTIAEWFGTAPPGWLNSESWSKPALIVMGLWGAGSGMILWLAGLKGVPTQLYEAASLDGASAWRQFWTVTLPQLSPIVFFNAVMGFIGALQEFDRVYVMRPFEGTAGPADSLLVPVFQLFDNGFKYFKLGYASALAWAIFFVILVLTLIQFKLAPRWVHYESER